MSDSHDSGAAGRIRDAITLGARTGLECATVHRDDLRAVLAENEAMREKLAGLRTQDAGDMSLIEAWLGQTEDDTAKTGGSS